MDSYTYDDGTYVGVTTNRPRQARPSAFELGAVRCLWVAAWRRARPEELSTGWLTGAGCVLRGADPSHRVNLGFVFLTCALSVFSGHLSVFSGQ